MNKTLIICEKSSAALQVAEALDISKNIRKGTKNGMPYFKIQTESEEVMVCSASGHFYGVDAKEKTGRHYPIWDLTWRPLFKLKRNQKWQEEWIKAIGEIAKECNVFINACDYDIEGSLIGFMMLKYACDGAEKKARRMKFSTLTIKELQEAYENLSQSLDFPLINAGMCRHEVDWIYGINLSKALTESARKYSKRYFTLSTGRVQGPTLKFIIEREKEISTFTPIPYWTIEASVDVDSNLVIVEYEKEKIKTKEEADNVVKESHGRYGKIENLETKKYHVSPPAPFDVSTLQFEAYRHFGLTPRMTVGIAERLYLNALISYPRTSSQKLPESIGFREILDKLSKIKEFENICNRLLSKGKLMPNEGKKSDSAHPAIYPTGIAPSRKLNAREKKIYGLIVRRFLATFGDMAIKQSDRADIKVADKTFYMRASRILKKGWIEYYEPYAKFDEVLLPPIKIGKEIKFVKVIAERKYTKPSPRYNPSSLLKLMEKENIGTKATRADIVDILYRRGYIKDERIIATPLALKIEEILTKYCPKVIEVSFTRELEKMMANIELGKESRENVVIETIENLKPVIDSLKDQEFDIGKELSETIRQMRQNEITFNVPCPECGSKLLVIRSKKSGKRFIGCSGMWEDKCRFSLPLPPFGTLTLLDKYCNECGFQKIRVKSTRKRPMISCPRCFVEKKESQIK